VGLRQGLPATGAPNRHPLMARHQESRRAHWDSVARWADEHQGWGQSYHKRLSKVFRFLIPERSQVLELGCGFGDLLAAVRPSSGVGVDFSSEMIRRAKLRHQDLEFIQADVHELNLERQFDFAILSDLANDLWDVQEVLEKLLPLCHARTRVIINSYSRLWEWPLALGQRLNMVRPTIRQNWLTPEDLAGLLELAGFEVLRKWTDVLCPFHVPVVATIANQYLVKMWPFRWFGLTNFVMARPRFTAPHSQAEPFVSVIVPARNEAGNIAQILARVPKLGAGTEIIFVEGHSSDGTYEEIHKAIACQPKRKCLCYRQAGKGKGDAVRLGFSKASGEILMILDADMTVAPEDLARFYNALISGKGELINGVRLVYPMEERAMRFFNLVANKCFGLVFSWLLGQPIKDTLCGTKVLWRKDYERVAANRAYFGDFDPFGDFDLLFGAAKLGLKIVDMPIRYCERSYGTTNIQRWRHGVLLLRMVLFAARRMKFV
jgi:ubiquinone/menaquinone biosynthesis C-methylase UbiE